MYRLVRLSNKWYAIKIVSVEDDAENIQIFVEQSDVILIANDLDDAVKLLNIERSDIILVH